MSNTPRNLTRNQLAEFLPNQRAVRAFEQLLKSVGELLPSDVVTLNRLIQETYLEATSGTTRAQEAIDLLNSASNDSGATIANLESRTTQALDALNSIAKSLDLLSKSPATQVDTSVKTDYVDFALVPRYTMIPGRVHWGSTGTLEIEMGGGNITQQVGEEFFTYGKATAAITEGQLIMVTGAVGASGVVTFAPTTTGLLDPNAILGVATENIALNGFGRVTMMGVVHGINTTGSSVGEVWADGDVLWYNAAFVGGMTKVKPVAPNMKTQVAIVINAGGGGSGSLQVEVLNGSTLGGTDANVQFSALVDKQLIQYDAVAGYWKNVAISSIGSTAAETHAAASKTTPVDADELPLADSTSSFSLKKLTWANLKATLATWINGTLIPASFTTLKATAAGTQVQVFNSGAGVERLYTTVSGTGTQFQSYNTAGTELAYTFKGLGTTWATLDGNGLALTQSLTTVGGAVFHKTSTTLTNGAGVAAGTLLNAPAAGNPTKWIGINDNGTTRYIPAW